MSRPWSLRRRLLAGILALILVLGVVIGGVSTAVLRGSLVDRLDRQLIDSAERSSDALIGWTSFLGGGDPPPVGDFVLGEGAGALGMIVVDGLVLRAGYLSETGDDVSLTPAQIEALITVPADSLPHTVDLGDGLGAYRVVIDAVSSDTAVIVGLPLTEVAATVGQLLLIIALVTAAALIIAGLLGAIVVRVALRPLDRVVETATRVSELRLDEGEVELAERVPEAATAPTTEVGRVGAAFNRLLGRVESALIARQASEDKLRRFVADASHELRTPLAAIRGYAEFLRMRGTKKLDADAMRSLDRIEAESKRMTILVEDLLLLARLDAGPALLRESVDLSRLLVDAVGDAHMAGPEHRWELELPDEPVFVTGDEARLHQVFANLLANARLHTPPGTRVRVAAEAGETVRVTVQDDGPGIPEELVPRLFERFARGDVSRVRAGGGDAGGGTGLGLAIVRAIVEGHGGRVSVQSAPGRTAFTVELPAGTSGGAQPEH